MGFHHRRIKSRRTGRYFCARWPSKRALQAARAAITPRTERRRLLLSVEAVVEDLNRFLIGWRNYYRFGNSSRAFTKLDWYSHHRLALFISKKHGRGRVFAWRLMAEHAHFGLERLTGNVWTEPVHASR